MTFINFVQNLLEHPKTRAEVQLYP